MDGRSLMNFFGERGGEEGGISCLAGKKKRRMEEAALQSPCQDQNISRRLLLHLTHKMAPLEKTLKL